MIDLQHNWVEELKTNGNQALERIYREYRISCVSWISKNFGVDKSEALDIFQESLLACHNNIRLGKAKQTEAGFRSYLYGIARYKALEANRKKEKRLQSETHYSVKNDISLFNEENSEYHKRYEILERLIIDLGDPCRTLLNLFYYHRLSLEHIRNKMNYSTVDTVKTKKYKCIKRLQKAYANRI